MGHPPDLKETRTTETEENGDEEKAVSSKDDAAQTPHTQKNQKVNLLASYSAMNMDIGAAPHADECSSLLNAPAAVARTGSI